MAFYVIDMFTKFAYFHLRRFSTSFLSLPKDMQSGTSKFA